jgi:hypothetical protein
MLRDIDLGDDAPVGNQRSHALFGRLPEIRHDQGTAEDIDRIMRCISSQQFGENTHKHQKIQQR